MTGRVGRSSWQRADLERFLDGDLSTEASAALAMALRADPALRDRLGQVRALDRAVAQALRGEQATPPRRASTGDRNPRHRGGIAWPRAAGLLIAAIVTARMISPAPQPAPRIDAEQSSGARHLPVPGVRVADATDASGVAPARRLALESQVLTRRIAHGALRTGASASASRHRGAPPLRLADQVASSRAAARTSPGSAPPAAALGGRSIELAYARLSGLDHQALVIAIDEMLADASMRAVVFEHIALLCAEPGRTDELTRLVARVDGDPSLRPWAIGYGLHEPGR
ncbi:MAG: hypothetical protein KF817_06460 [Phycisphaeraceae bacterium]|nr:hypothetical protein [Phycisphaeraceae bacterium]